MKKVLLICIVGIFLMVISYFIDAAACYTKGQSFEAVDYSLIGGCMVKHNNRWLPLDNIRGFDNKG